MDPDGEFVFLIPHISFSGGSFDIGITLGLGFPGGSAVTATIGHSFQDGPDNTYVSFGANLGPVGASVGWGTQTGFTAGVGTGYGFGGPITQNFTSIGVSWTQNYGISANVSAWSRSNGGWHFNPSVGVAPGFGFERTKTSNPFNDPYLTASADPEFIAYGPEAEIIGKLSPSQRFKQWQRNRSQWGNWSTYRGPQSVFSASQADRSNAGSNFNYYGSSAAQGVTGFGITSGIVQNAADHVMPGFSANPIKNQVNYLNANAVGRMARVGGGVLAVGGLAATAYQFGQDGTVSSREWAQLGVQVAITGIGFLGPFGLAASVGLMFLEANYGHYLYNRIAE